jgi:glycosyltransferase involved in cell wall biosynthesis
VTWQASSNFEAADIRRHFSNDVELIPNELAPLNDEVNRGPSRDNVVVAPDLLVPPPLHGRYRRQKEPGHLRVAFISRITKMKNVEGALRMLMTISGDLSLDIYGPIEDREYWNECKKLIPKLPSNVRVSYLGEVAHEEVAQVLAEHDIFLLPTRGENFGHVIYEALAAGCPVLISDQTPWRNLTAAGVGWDLPLDDVSSFGAALQQCVDGDDEWYSQLSARAVAYAFEISSNPESSDASRKLFERGA